MIAIDIFEAMLLIEAAWPDGTALKSSVLQKAVNVWYHSMNPKQRGQIHVFLHTITKTRQAAFTINQQLILSRYNPAKQIYVFTKNGVYEAFMFQGRHHTHTETSVRPELIIKTEPNNTAITT